MVVVVVVVAAAHGRSLEPPFTTSPTRRRSWRRRKVVLFKGREFLRVHIKRPIGCVSTFIFSLQPFTADDERDGKEESFLRRQLHFPEIVVAASGNNNRNRCAYKAAGVKICCDSFLGRWQVRVCYEGAEQGWVRCCITTTTTTTITVSIKSRK